MKDCYKTCNSDRYVSLHDNAKRMRNEPTEAEILLWQYLRGNKLGYKFRRQHPIDDYIADFVCLSKMLIVEIDGGYHTEDNQIEHDDIRDKWLEHLGYKTIRFTNDEIFTELDVVLNKIKTELNVR